MDSIVVQGLFDLSKDKVYVIVDNKRHEVGKFEISKGNYYAKIEGKETITFGGQLEIEDWLNDHAYALATDSWRWYEYNPNPEGKITGDCTIRAYCAAEHMEWGDAYDLACATGKEMSLMPNENKVVKRILTEKLDYDYCKQDKEKKDQTVKEFAIEHDKGTFLLSVARHLVTVIDGEYWDSWDSGDKKVKGWYYKKTK